MPIPRTKLTLLVGTFVFSAAVAVGAQTAPVPATAPTQWNFNCGANNLGASAVALSPEKHFTTASPEGFDLGTTVNLEKKSCSSDKPFFFSVNAPEGTYLVTVTLGSDEHESITTVKAESRRLMLEGIKTASRHSVTEIFTVHVRTKAISPSANVRLKPREVGALDWDEKLTLEFIGTKPSFRTLSIKKVDTLPVVYLAGDSTVVDQDKEPWAAWGQMLPRFFDSRIVISNQAESGETIRSFVSEKRFEKIFSTIKAGDYLFMQFNHNDQKPGKGQVLIPDYKDYLKQYIRKAKELGATPVLVTSMNRRSFDEKGKITHTLGDYPETMRQVAKEENVALIDLTAMSKTLFEAMGPEVTLKAFVHYPANSFPGQTEAINDDTHFTDYGAYELARCIVNGVKEAKLPLAQYQRKGVKDFNPAKPDKLSDWTMPLDPQSNAETPYGR